MSYPITRLSKEQWNIDMINAVDAWKMGFNGKGITIMIVDTGTDNTHPDLRNIDEDISIGINGNTYVPEKQETHGTMVASIAAGTGTKYVTGVAWGSKLGSIQFIGSDLSYKDALLHNIDKVDIYNNSWGYNFVDYIGPLSRVQLLDAVKPIERGVKIGRRCKGAIYVFAAGNQGDIGVQTAFEPLLNLHEVITVAAINKIGSRSSYSTYGSAILVSAPGGYDNTPNTGLGIPSALPIDRNFSPYTLSMNGTSASAPHISGIVAMMLQANPSLTWRDVQHILMYSSFHTFLWLKDFMTVNANNLYYHRFTGYGVPSCPVACMIAKNWITLPPMRKEKKVIKYHEPIELTDTEVITEFEYPLLDSYVAECLILSVSIIGKRALDLVITITSPSGTHTSMVREIKTDKKQEFMYNLNIDIKAEAYRDEPVYIPGNKWKVHLSDKIEGETHHLNAVELEVRCYQTSDDYRSKIQDIVHKAREYI